MRFPYRKTLAAFTIVELLVGVIAIAVLLSMVIPAVGGARGASQVDVSLSNLNAMHVAFTSYANDFNDRQPTAIVDNFSTFGSSGPTALFGYAAAEGEAHPPLLLGECNQSMWGFYFPPNPVSASAALIMPIQFQSGSLQSFGFHRIPNAKLIHDYVGGKLYSREFYAPADRTVHPILEPLFDHSCEFVNTLPQVRWSSYCLSAAAMFDPQVLRRPSEGGFVDPFAFADGFKSRNALQVKYSNLKTRMMEHNWNQNAPADRCNPSFATAANDGCTPHFFNSAPESEPATLFFDGSTRVLPNTEAMNADAQVLQQTGGVDGLWHRGTPLGANGYYSQVAMHNIQTSHHVLTTDGILGRDTIQPDR